MNDESATAAELEEKIREMFEEADTDGSGTLSTAEFKVLLNKLDASLSLKLSEAQHRQLLASADVDEDGSISFDEFCPVAAKIISNDNLKREKQTKDAKDGAKVYLVHGMKREALNTELKRIFNQADADKTGFLSRKQFREALQITGLGISRQEANLLLQKVDVDGNGFIDYNEFVPTCFDLLAQLVADRLLAHMANEEQTRHFLAELFTTEDPEGTGKLSLDKIKSTLIDADLGFTDEQVELVASKCTKDDDMCDYRRGVEPMSKVVNSILNASMEEPNGDSFQAMTSNLGSILTRASFESGVSELMGSHDKVPSQELIEACKKVTGGISIEYDILVKGEDVEWKLLLSSIYDTIVDASKTT